MSGHAPPSSPYVSILREYSENLCVCVCRLVAHQGLMLWRDVRRMRPGGEGACVTMLLEMPFGAQR